jgi:hypothetical protein
MILSRTWPSVIAAVFVRVKLANKKCWHAMPLPLAGVHVPGTLTGTS